jgi:chromate transporter
VSAGTAGEVFRAALKLGLTSFGGPIAHFGYFRAEYVQRRRWLRDEAYAELVAVCQLLPGPASSQVGVCIGYLRAGWFGALAAWVGFTLPSAIAMACFAAFVGSVGLAAQGAVADAVWLRALQLVAVAVVLDAVLGMGRRLLSTAPAFVTMFLAFLAVTVTASGYAQVAVLALAGFAGVVFAGRFRLAGAVAQHAPVSVSRRVGLTALAVLVLLLAGLPLLAEYGPRIGLTGQETLLRLADALYRSGALVFGGGHVVLPLLEGQTVPSLVGESEFLAGYGFAQAVPGPLFTFGTYLGQAAAGIAGAVAGTVAIFLPGFLVLFGVLPFWERLRGGARVQAGLAAVNAAVVGVLAAALYDPLITGSVRSIRDAVFAAALFAGLRLWRLPAWVVVLAALVASPLLDL